MADAVIVYKNRTNVVPVDLGFDVSTDVITSQIREGKTPSSQLIAEWEVAFLTDGVDGKLLLTLDDSVLLDIPQNTGYMDLKRVSSGEPYPVFSDPVTVKFKWSVTV